MFRNLCNNFVEEPERGKPEPKKPEKILMQLVKTISVGLNKCAHFLVRMTIVIITQAHIN